MPKLKYLCLNVGELYGLDSSSITSLRILMDYAKFNNVTVLFSFIESSNTIEFYQKEVSESDKEFVKKRISDIVEKKECIVYSVVDLKTIIDKKK